MSSQNTKIAIFPAAGGLGGSTYTHLLNSKLVSPSNVVLISRHPEKIPKSFVDAGVTIRAADYDKPETLEHAFDGVKCLNLISYASIEHEHRFKVHKQAIDAALKSGVTRILYSSLAFGGSCTPSSLAFVMQAHLDTEAYLSKLATENSSFTYTAVRQGIYSKSFPLYTAFFNLEEPAEKVCIPDDGKGPGVAWAKRDELGEATAKILAAYADAESPKLTFPHTNKTILLSGPKVWSLEETVNVLSRVTGKKVEICEVDVDEYMRQPSVRAAGTYGSGEAARQMITAFEAIKKGEAAVVSPLLKELLGREPEAFDVTVANMAKA